MRLFAVFQTEAGTVEVTGSILVSVGAGWRSSQNVSAHVLILNITGNVVGGYADIPSHAALELGLNQGDDGSISDHGDGQLTERVY